MGRSLGNDFCLCEVVVQTLQSVKTEPPKRFLKYSFFISSSMLGVNCLLKKENKAYIIWSQHRRQELIVSDVLHHGTDDFACFVEQSSSRPGRVEEVQLQGYPVVFSYPDSVHRT